MTRAAFAPVVVRQPVITPDPAVGPPTGWVKVISASGFTLSMPTRLAISGPGEPVALLVVAADGDPHPELWDAATVPVLVVLPPRAAAAAVLAAFAAGADACVRASSSAEVTAHLGALLRRHAAPSPRISPEEL